MKFKTGDRVNHEVLGNGTVLYVDSDDKTYLVKFDGGFEIWRIESSLREDELLTFSYGEKETMRDLFERINWKLLLMQVFDGLEFSIGFGLVAAATNNYKPRFLNVTCYLGLTNLHVENADRVLDPNVLVEHQAGGEKI